MKTIKKMCLSFIIMTLIATTIFGVVYASEVEDPYKRCIITIPTDSK